jgi:uncharacterized protein YbaA (DUF1428 family)
MTYIDCFLAPIPRENRAAYEELAEISAQVVKEYGSLRVVECWLDESGPDASSYHGKVARLESEEYGSFVKAAGAGEGETVVLSFIEWPDKAARDAGMARVTSDPCIQFLDRPPVFDGKRLLAAERPADLLAPQEGRKHSVVMIRNGWETCSTGGRQAGKSQMDFGQV